MIWLDRGVKFQAVLSKTLIEKINQKLLHYIIINYITILH